MSSLSRESLKERETRFGIEVEVSGMIEQVNECKSWVFGSARSVNVEVGE